MIIDDSDKGRRCTFCDNGLVFSIQPGSDGVYVQKPTGPVLVKRAESDVHWCLECWMVKYGSGQIGQSAR